MTPRRAVLVLIAPALLSLCSESLSAQPAFTVVAQSGDTAPGLNDNFGVFSSPLINNAGQVAFRGAPSFNAQFAGPTGVYVAAPGNLHLIAKSGDPAPGASGVTFDTPFLTAFSETGQVAVGSYLQGPGLARFDVFAHWIGSANQPLTYVAGHLMPAQGIPSATLSSPGAPRIAGGNLAFGASLNNLPNGTPRGFLWAGTPASFNPIVSEYAAPPGVSDGLYGGAFFPALNGAGQIAFVGEIVALDKQYTGQLGIWYGTFASQQLVLRNGDPAPQIPGKNILINRFNPPKLNRSGQLSMVLDLGPSDADPLLEDRAVYTGTPGNLQLRARTGQPAPGMPSGVYFGGETDYGHGAGSFDSIAHSANDDVAFRGLVSGPGIGMLNNDGLWLGRAGQPLQLIAKEGDRPPGAPAGARFLADNSDLDQYNPVFSDPSINKNGQIVFYATYEDVPGHYIAGIYATDADDTLHLILYPGQQIDLGNGIIKTLDNLGDRYDHGLGSASEDGQNFVFNDAGQFVFNAHFTDGTQAILITTVPEPGVTTLIAPLAATLLIRRRPTASATRML
jgi:hypothetical protein